MKKLQLFYLDPEETYVYIAERLAVALQAELYIITNESSMEAFISNYSPDIMVCHSYAYYWIPRLIEIIAHENQEKANKFVRIPKFFISSETDWIRKKQLNIFKQIGICDVFQVKRNGNHQETVSKIMKHLYELSLIKAC